MDKVINRLGIAILVSKYATVLFILGMAFGSGALSGEGVILAGMNSND